MGNNTWGNTLDPFAGARGAAFGTFTTAKDVSPLPLPQCFGNELRVGTLIDLEASGEFSTTGTPTLQLGFGYGATAGGATGTIIAQSGVITTASGAAAFPWHMLWQGIVTAVGASGVIYGQGTLDLGTSLTVISTTAMPVTAAARSVTIDTTALKLWSVNAAWGTSSASNTLTVNRFVARILNQGKTS